MHIGVCAVRAGVGENRAKTLVLMILIKLLNKSSRFDVGAGLLIDSLPQLSLMSGARIPVRAIHDLRTKEQASNRCLLDVIIIVIIIIASAVAS
jgi:hypothetical protein